MTSPRQVGVPPAKDRGLGDGRHTNPRKSDFMISV